MLNGMLEWNVQYAKYPETFGKKMELRRIEHKRSFKYYAEFHNLKY